MIFLSFTSSIGSSGLVSPDGDFLLRRWRRERVRWTRHAGWARSWTYVRRACFFSHGSETSTEWFLCEAGGGAVVCAVVKKW